MSNATEDRLHEDVALVVEYLSGDERAFDKIVCRYQTRLVNFIYRTIGDHERAEDLSQETFKRVHKHIRRYDQSKTFSTWIYTIASNLAKNELRDRARNPLILFQVLEAKKREEGDDRVLNFESTAPGPDEILERNRLRRILDDALEELPPHMREMFLLIEIEGKSYEEASKILGINLGTVKSRVHRARSSLMASVLVHPEW